MPKKPLLILFLVVFIDLVGFGMIIPILPYYAKSFGASATTLGLLMMSYSAMQFLFSPLWGRLSDRIGRRPVILSSIAGVGASMLVLGGAKTLFWLFIGRAFAGLFGANISAASAYIADVTKPEHRARGMGLIGAAFGLGFLFGPALGGILSKWGYGTAAFVAAGLSFANFLFAWVILKEPPASQDRRPLSLAGWKKTLRRPPVRLAIILFFLVTLSMAQLETSFALFLLARFGLDAVHAGWILALMALIMVGVQGRAIGPMVRRFGEAGLVKAGVFIMMVSLIAVSFSPRLTLFISFLLVYALGYAMTNPSLSSLASRHSSVDSQGMSLGVYQSFGSLARILGPLLAGFLFDAAGIRAPFLAASLLFMAALCFVRVKGKVWS